MDGQLLGVAGLWESWRDGAGAEVRSFSIITTAANELLAPVHDRMPVIVDDQNYGDWLEGSAEQARSLMRSGPAERMRMWRVSQAVNKVGVMEGVECVREVEDEGRLAIL